MNLLKVENLEVRFDTHEGRVSAVNGLSFELGAGKTLGIVGESGSGKTQTALAIMGLLAQNGRVSGSVQYGGRELLGLPRQEFSRIRGASMAMVFQDPMTCLNPYLTVGSQMAEVLVRHRGMQQGEALAEAARWLDMVRIADARNRLQQYPHEFSGGMRQRVMIAMALLCKPQLLLADEPTTAVDVTVQAQILKVLAELRRELKLAIVLITHDLDVVGELCDRVLVMYAGQLMECGDTSKVLHRPTHPYTAALMRSRPRLEFPLTRELATIPGQPPDMLHVPAGCPFHSRCGYVEPRCMDERPSISSANHGGTRACHVQGLST